MRDSKLSSMEDADDKGHSGIHTKIAIPDLSDLVSVDMRVLKSGRMCRPGQYILGGVLIIALSPMAILAQDVQLYAIARFVLWTRPVCDRDIKLPAYPRADHRLR